MRALRRCGRSLPTRTCSRSCVWGSPPSKVRCCCCCDRWQLVLGRPVKLLKSASLCACPGSASLCACPVSASLCAVHSSRPSSSSPPSCSRLPPCRLPTFPTPASLAHPRADAQDMFVPFELSSESSQQTTCKSLAGAYDRWARYRHQLRGACPLTGALLVGRQHF